MQIRYDNTIEDILTFRKFLAARSPTVRRDWALLRLRCALVGFVFSLVLCNSLGSVPAMILLSVAGAVAGGLILPVLYQKYDQFQTRKIYSGANARFLGARELEILDDGIVERIAGVEVKLAWVKVERIESTSDYTYIYSDPTTAVIVPHAHILEGDFRLFLAELGQRYQPYGQLIPTA